MFLLRYPQRTEWIDRDRLPEPHPWTTDPKKSFSLKETRMLAFLFFFVLVVVLIFTKYPQHKAKIILGLVVFWVVFMLFPLTSLTAMNLVVTCVTRTPALHLDKNVYFPQALLLERPDVFARVREETVRLLETQKTIPLTGQLTLNNQYIASDKTNGNGWRAYTVKTANAISPKAREQLPFLASLLEQMPNVINALVSILPPKTCIPIHHGYYKGFVRYHLGLIVPEPDKTILHVNGNKYHWHEGEGLVWDDMFPHEVFNASNQTRTILYLDVVRVFPASPALSKLNRQYCEFLSRSPIVKYTQSADEQLK